MEKLRYQLMSELDWGYERTNRVLKYMIADFGLAGLEQMSLNDLVDYAQTCYDVMRR
jgi:hypothetical protein